MTLILLMFYLLDSMLLVFRVWQCLFGLCHTLEDHCDFGDFALMVGLNCVLSFVPCTCHSTMIHASLLGSGCGVILTCLSDDDDDDAMPMNGRLAHNIYQPSFVLVI